MVTLKNNNKIKKLHINYMKKEMGKKLQNTIRSKYFIFAGISMLVGAAIYPLFRSCDILVWQILPEPSFWHIFHVHIHTNDPIILFFIYSGPDFLWFLSGIFLLRGFWLFEPNNQNKYLVVFYIIVFGLNVGQYLRIVPGTFDLIDLLAISNVALIEGIIYNVFIKRRINYDEKKS